MFLVYVSKVFLLIFAPTLKSMSVSVKKVFKIRL